MPMFSLTPFRQVLLGLHQHDLLLIFFQAGIFPKKNLVLTLVNRFSLVQYCYANDIILEFVVRTYNFFVKIYCYRFSPLLLGNIIYINSLTRSLRAFSILLSLFIYSFKVKRFIYFFWENFLQLTTVHFPNTCSLN